MEDRLKFQEVLPAAWKAMYALSGTQANSKLSKAQIALMTTRASQINGCSFCINMHTKEALAAGESMQRLFLLSAWKETDKFSEEERTLLAITEEVTLISQQGLSSATYKKAKELFSDEIIAQAILTVVTINAWNRIAISTLMPVGE